MQELEQKIHDFIRTNYEAIYDGLLRVTKKEDIYTLVLGVPSYMSPTTISCQANSDEEFLDYIYKELTVRNYVRIYFYRGSRTEYVKDN